VVDSAFRVHGAQRLRVVDASIFPRIPGFFIVTPIYMISEKAADVILADAVDPDAHLAPGRSPAP
jgi:choline dehydrogenase